MLIGAGHGMFMSPNSSAVLGAVPRPRLGTASGMTAETRVVGQAIGIVVSAAVVALRLPIHLAEAGAAEGAAGAADAALVAAIHDAFVVAALICSIGIVTSLVRGGGAGERPTRVTDGQPPGTPAAGSAGGTHAVPVP